MREKRFTNGCFLTLDPAHPPSDELRCLGGRIVSLGRHAQGSAAEVVDLGGRTVIPGPVDAHCHLVSYGMLQIREAELRGATSLSEIGVRLRSHARRRGIEVNSGRWLLGRAFDQELLPGGAWPTRADLDELEPTLPVVITRVCGHALVANSVALQQAGLPADAHSGALPSGVLTETEMRPLLTAIPSPTPEEWLTAAEWACNAAARAGFVGAHSLMANAAEIRALLDLHRRASLPVRVLMQLPFPLLEHAVSTGLRTGFGDDFLALGAVKLFSDGSLGARTAALREPYADDPANNGELIYAIEELTERVGQIYRGGFQACIHAIGDRAMAETLTALEVANDPARGGSLPILPPRIEHASMVDEDLIERLRALGVGVAVQPQFAWSDRWLPERVGPARIGGCYALHAMWTAGVPMAGSTDCPVETLDAMAAIGAMVQPPDWLPGARLPLDTALRVFSEGAYTISGRDPGLGRLAPGGYADFVVLEEDPRRIPTAELARIPVAMTVVGGEIRYAATGVD